MPLPKRCVEPVLVSRGTVPDRLSVPSELEAVTNGTLANTVRQLSSLSKHAEDMFGELARDAGALSDRANQLQARIDRLAVKVTQLDSGVEEVSIQDIQMRKAFRSTRTFDQQIFSRGTMPTAMLATYARCDRPPPLDRLNAFRDDGRDALKFYTDPGYFFELWRQEMLQDTERIQHDRGKKVRQPRTSDGGGGGGARRVRPPHSTRERQRAAAAARGEHIMPAAALARHNHHHQAQALAAREREQFYDTTIVDGRSSTHSSSHYASQQQLAARPSSIEIANAYQPYQQQRSTPLAGANGHGMEEAIYMSSGGSGTEPIYGGSAGGSGAGTPRRARPSVPPPAPPAVATSPPTSAQHTPARSTLPPPPPPPEVAGSPPPPPALTNGAPPQAPSQLRSTLDTHLDEMHNAIGLMSSDLLPPPAPASPEAPPPPPPPPPPPAPPAPLPNGDARPPPPSAADLLRGASGLKAAPAPAPPLVDPRSDLLKAIRDGIKLRKVEKRANDANGRYNTLTSNSAPGLHDVASILARRVAVELSDTSSSEGESDDLDSDGGWGESRA